MPQGPDLSLFSELSNRGLDVRPLSDEIGHASAIKMCYASLTKGLTALCTELLTAAQVLGVSEALTAEFQLSQSALFERMEKGLPGMPPKARRWIGEMEEISATFAYVGLTPNILTGCYLAIYLQLFPVGGVCHPDSFFLQRFQT